MPKAEFLEKNSSKQFSGFWEQELRKYFVLFTLRKMLTNCFSERSNFSGLCSSDSKCRRGGKVVFSVVKCLLVFL